MTKTTSTVTNDTTKKSKSMKQSSSKDLEKMDVEDLSTNSNDNDYQEGTEEDNISYDKQVGSKRKYKKRAKKAYCWKYFDEDFEEGTGWDGMIMTKEEEEKILEEILGEVKTEMQVVVNEYENLYQMGTTTTTVRKESVPIRSGKNAWMSNYESRHQDAQTFGKKSELEKYLKDEVEEETEDFDILKWWKYNESRYPTLVKMGKDILAIPISSVASEAAFSIGGRVIEPCRSSLSPQIVKALICS
ncbi:hypothetical protein SSX86_005318 [Deinandra increscens subsp. villosa]|uniref:HAT C-terminal dimerisation domain-containing protein n=1 Tax=Deinandra increscens subsp. villosa TaxID=3103831 RepID=A0AAP0DPS0_9ASTR